MNTQEDKVSLSELIRPENILYVDGRVGKDELIKTLASRLYPELKEEITEKYLLEKIFEVEKLNNVLETGFYVPHAKLSEIDDFKCALAFLGEGIKDPESGIMIKACLLLLTPNRPGFFQKHLYILSRLSQLFTEEFIAEMAQARDPSRLLQALKSAE